VPLLLPIVRAAERASIIGLVPITKQFHILVELNRLGELASIELEGELPGKTFELGSEEISRRRVPV